MQGKNYRIEVAGDMIGVIAGDNNHVGGITSHKSSDRDTRDSLVEEIQKLIEQLSQADTPRTTAQQMVVASKVIETIEKRPNWKNRAIKALKQGAMESLKTHPIGALIVGAIEGWKE